MRRPMSSGADSGGHGFHLVAQARGKDEIFADFRISVAEVMRDYMMADWVAGAS